MKANIPVRQLLKNNNIPFWEIAIKLNIHESTLIRWMRTPLPIEKESQIKNAISLILNERKYM